MLRLGLFATLLAAPGLGWAAQVALTPEQLCEASDLVAVVEVTSTEVRWSEGPTGGLETHTWLSVRDVITGEMVDTVEVVLPGGRRDGLVQWVEHVPRLHVDRTYVVFLSREGATWRPTGGEDSAVPVALHRAESWPSVDEVLGHLGSCGGR